MLKIRPIKFFYVLGHKQRLNGTQIVDILIFLPTKNESPAVTHLSAESSSFCCNLQTITYEE